MMSKRSKWRPLKSAGVAEGSWGIRLIIYTLHRLHQSRIPHGGHQITLRIAAGLGLGGNESYLGVFQPFGGFADNVPVEGGRVHLPNALGIGIELKADLMRVFTPLAKG